MNDKIICLHTEEKGCGLYSTDEINENTIILREQLKIFIHKKQLSSNMINLWLVYLVYQNKKLKQLFENFVPTSIDSLCKSEQQIKMMLLNIKPVKLQRFFDSLAINEIILAFEKIKRNCFDCSGKVFIVFNGTKFNHSCNPNTDCYFNTDSNTLTFVTNKNIKSGEELTIEYINHTANRLCLYFTYGFNCKCEICLSNENFKNDDT